MKQHRLPGTRKSLIRLSSGFTLIEVMIAMVLLAILSVLTAQTMRAGIRDRETISNELSRESKVSDALRIIRNDVNSAYHYRDIFITIMNNAAKPAENKKGLTGVGNDPGADGSSLAGGLPPAQPAAAPVAAEPAASPRPTPAVTTGFIGDSESMYFTSLSNARTIQDSQQSDQAKIGYYVKSCRARGGPKREMVATKCLFRATSPYLDEEVEKAGEETVLLEHVEQFKLRYLGPGHDDLEYVDTWKTGKNGDANTKENFPYAVEVTISTEDKTDPKNIRVVASSLIPIRFPNNPVKAKEGDPATGADGQPPKDTGSFNPGVGPNGKN